MLVGGRRFAVGARAAIVASVLTGAVSSAHSETLEQALVLSYQNNPQLNAQRAATRATDENVSIALSGYRPRLTATSSLSEVYLENVARVPMLPGSARTAGQNAVTTVGATGTQTLFNGFQTGNRTRQAEAQVFAARETLRASEQTVLLNAATAYMNLLRDAAILELQRSNVNVLEATLRQARDRLRAGEVTRTDVAQAESRLAGGRSQYLTAESNYVTSKAQYQQVIGGPPGQLRAATPVDRFSPRTLTASLARANTAHPTITAAMYAVDAAAFQVKIAEGALYPTVTLQGSVTQSLGSATNVDNLQNFNASIGAQLSVPLYQGGQEYATIRQAKETLGQRRLDLDTARDAVKSNATQAWAQLEAAKAQIESTTAQVNAAEISLNGVRDEARVGQRTTLDVLNAQQELVNARAALVTAQRDRVVASYTLLSAVGSLSPQVLGLRIQNYDPVTHYHQVRDAWIGVRTPDGR